MGNESDGEPGGSGLQDLRLLLKKTREKYQMLFPDDARWPCPFCLHKAKTLVQCSIHVKQDHKILSRTDIRDTLSQSVLSSMDSEGTQKNFTPNDLTEFLKLIESSSQVSEEQSEKPSCRNCGFIAKNTRGLNIHLHTCNKRNLPSSDDEQTSAPASDENLIERLVSLRFSKRIMNRVPKGARKLVSEELTKAIIECTRDNSESSWEKLFTFSFNALQLPPKSEKRKCSLATTIRRNILQPDLSTRPKPLTNKQSQSRDQIIKTAMSKLSDGDIKGSVRVLSSDEVIAPYNIATLEALIKKHPKRVEVDVMNDVDEGEEMASEQTPVSRAEIVEALRSFANGSAGGIDGLRPQHLKDLVSQNNSHLADHLTDALCRLADIILFDKVPVAIRPILFGANLTALLKKDGGIRPIAVGNTIRRLSAKVSCNRIRDEAANYLAPRQMGFAVPGGAEAIVHSIRNFLSSPEGEDSILVKLDYSNAFNSIYRWKMIAIVKEKFPSMYNFVSQCYNTKSYLCYGSDIILSEEGVQQGDPLGPLLFCIVIQPIIESLHSQLNQWYLDDGSVGGHVDSVVEDLKKIISLSEDVGLKLNPSKCEVLRIKPLSEFEKQKLNEVIPGISIPSTESFSLLGAPLLLDGIPSAIEKKILNISLLISRLDGLNSHQALFLLKNCLAIPRMMHLLRSAPCWLFKEKLDSFDNMIKDSAEAITNVSLDEKTWMQCTLPIKKGGLGLISAADIASSAFISSMEATNHLQQQIMPSNNELLDSAIEFWKLESAAEIPFENSAIQKSWSIPVMERKFADLTFSFGNDACQKARLLASSQEESGLWLSALPSSSLGLRLDNDTLRISVALRLGAKICHPHKCICLKDVDIYGYHGLSCKKASGTRPRHYTLNETIRKGVVSAGLPAILEPPGVVREDGKRPDGLTLIPWSKGKCLLWDATCRDTVAKSYVNTSSRNAGWVAKTAENKKIELYHSLLDQYYFVPVGFETLGPWGPHAKQFISDLGKRIADVTNDKRSTLFLKQRISIDIQRGNAASVLGTLPSTEALDEVYYLLSNRKSKQ